MSDKILCVDDDPNILAGYQRNLRRKFTLDTAQGGEEALAIVKRQGPYAVVVADMKMPGMDGIELLTQIRHLAPDTVRFVLTGNADQQTAIDAINKGYIFRFLTKPCSPENLAKALDAGLEQYRLITAERELLEKTLGGSIKMLTEILSLVEPQFFGRGQMLRDYARSLAPILKITQVWELEVASMLCQIGYVTIPASIIQKERGALPLTPSEKQIVERVPEIGAKLLTHIPRLESVARIVQYQHKNFDGTGFPHDSVSGEQIPLGSRVLRALSDLVQQEIAGGHKGDIIHKMKNRPGAYDPRVMEAAYTALVENPKLLASGQAVTLKDLATGQVLLSDAMTSDGMLIVPSGTEITPMVLQKLNNFAQLTGIREPIYISK